MKNHPISLFLLGILLIAGCNLDKIEEPSVSCINGVQAAFETDKTSGVIPCEVTFTNKTIGAVNYNWTFTGTQTSSVQNPGKVTFSIAGNYEVMLIASNANGCADTAVVMLMIIDPQQPTVACFSITSQTNSGAAPATIGFSAVCTQNATNFAWNFGDASSGSFNTATGIDAQHTFNTPGSYSVKLSATGPANSDDTTILVTIKQPVPKAAFSVVNDGCDAPCTVQFTNTSQNAISWQWDFGDGGNSVIESPSHIFQAKGVYNVRLIVTGSDNMTKDTTVKSVTVLKLPVANFNFTNNNCIAPCTVTFTSTSQFENSYIWNFGDGSATSMASNPSHTYQENGEYSVKLIVINTDGADTITKLVSIKSENFKAVIDVNGSDLTPLYGVECPDGQLHVLFSQNGYKSVLINPSQIVGNIVSYSFPDLSEMNEITDADEGGFALVGSTANLLNATLVKITRMQTTGFSKTISFSGISELSKGQGVMLNSSNNFVVTGSYTPLDYVKMYPGLAFVSQTGEITLNTFVNSPNPSLGLHYAEGITQLDNGKFMMVANENSTGASSRRYLIGAFDGAYGGSKGLGTSDSVDVFQIRSFGNSCFIWQSTNGINKLVRYNTSQFTSEGSIALNNISASQILIAADGHIIACGTKNGSAWMAKFNSSTMSTTPIWEKTYSEPSGSSAGVSVARLDNGGFLLTGTHTSSTGQKRLYLVKTDSNGNTD